VLAARAKQIIRQLIPAAFIAGRFVHHAKMCQARAGPDKRLL